MNEVRKEKARLHTRSWQGDGKPTQGFAETLKGPMCLNSDTLAIVGWGMGKG